MLGDRKILRVEGLIIGVVLRATSNTDLINVPWHIGNQSTDATQPIPARPYYISTDDIRWGLLSYLYEFDDGARGFFRCDRPEQPEHTVWLMPHIRLILTIHYFYRRLRVRAACNLLCISRSIPDTDDDNTTREAPEPPEVTARRTLNRWLATNMTFSIQGTNLEAWFSPSRSFSFIFHVLDSPVAYVLLAPRILLTFSPAIICFLEARSKFPIVFAILGLVFFAAAVPLVICELYFFHMFRDHCQDVM